MITLKKLKVLDSLSEETLCYTADVYWKGRLIGYVKNRGHGGQSDFRPTLKASAQDIRAARADAEARPFLDGDGTPIKNAGTGKAMYFDLEDWCDDLACQMHERKAMQRRLVRLMKSETLFCVQGEERLFQTNAVISDPVRAFLRTKHGQVEFLNDMPISDAVELALERC